MGRGGSKHAKKAEVYSGTAKHLGTPSGADGGSTTWGCEQKQQNCVHVWFGKTQLGIHCTMVFGTSGWPVSSLFRHIGFCMAMSGTLVWLEHHPSHPSSPVGPGHDQIHKVPRCTKYTPRWIRSVLPLVPHISIGSLSGSERSRILLAARHRKREEHVTFSQLGRPRHGEAHNINTSRKTDGSHAIQRYWALALGPKSRIFITKVV